MGDVLGGTRSGSAQGSLYWGSARVSISLLYQRSAGEHFYICSPALALLGLFVHGFQRLNIPEQFDPAINACFALRL